jgi:F-type H+-transporting ATPase subunit b
MRIFKNIRICAACAVPFALASLPVWAEEAAGGGQGGMPQFDVTLFPSQIFWLVATFAALYLLMAFVALPRVSKTQSNRKTVIAREIETARQANTTAKASVASTEKALAEARDKAQARVGEMLAKVAEEANERRVAQERELVRKLHRAEEDIATSRAAALEKIQANANDLAKAVVDKILGVTKRSRA